MVKFKSYGLRIILFFFLVFQFSANSFSQDDSTKKDLSFDFGITRGRNINLWPILRRVNSEEKSELQILYPIFSKTINYKSESKHLHILPFFIGDSSTKGVDRRFLSFYYPTIFRYQKQNLSGTKISSFRFLELAPNISCLSFGRSPDGLFVENNMFFFIWYKKDLVKDKTRMVVFPAYWYFSNKRDTTQLFFPLYYSKKSESGKRNVLFPLWWRKTKYLNNDTITRSTIFPLFWSKRSRNESNSVFFPFVYSFKDRDYESFTFFPFYSVGHSGKSGNRYSAVTPFLWHFEKTSGSKNILFPVYWGSKRYLGNDTIKKNTVFPIYWSKESRDEISQLFLPFVYRYKTPQYRSFTFFPFFSRGQATDSENRYFAITPLYWHFEKENSRKDIIFPFYWSSKLFLGDDTVVKRTIFPVYWSVRSKTKNNQILFPLVYRLNNQRGKSLTIFPLFSYGHKAHSDKKYFAITPLFWHHKKEKSRKDVLFPLYWGSKSWLFGDTVTRKTLFPLYWSVKMKDRSTHVLFPLVFKLSNPGGQSLTFFPFFSYGHKLNSERRYFAVTPFFWHFERAKFRKDILFPLYWSKTRFLEDDTIIRKTFFPFYWFEKSRDKSHSVLFPFVYKFKNPSYSSLTVLPLFSAGHSPDFSNRHLDLFPVFWRVKTNEGQATVVFPLWWSSQKYFQNDTITKKLLFPFYWWVNSRDKSNRVLFPFIYSFNNRWYSSFTFFPLYSSGHSNDLRKSYSAITPLFWRSKNPHGSRDILFPIYWGSKHFLKDDTIRRNTVFPIYWSKQSKDEISQLFLPFIYRFKTTEYRSFTFFPFYSAGRSTDQKTGYSLILPLFCHSKSPDGTRDILFPLYWGSKRYLENDTIKKNTVFPLYWSKESKDETSQLFFPLAYRFKDKRYSSFTFFPFFSKGHSPDNSRSYFELFQIFWHLRDKEKSNTVLLPFWWSNQQFFDNDTISFKTFFPLYWSKKSNYKSYHVLFPLVYSFKNAKYHSFTFFPLFSSGHSVDRSKKHLIITPLVGVFSKPGKTRAFLFPVFSYKKTPAETHASAFLFLFRRTARENYSKTSVLWPICEQLKSGSNSAFRIAPFIWYSRTDSSKMFSFLPFFYSYRSIPRSTFSLFWVLFKHENNVGNSVSNSILWKLFTSEKFVNGDFEKRFIYLVYSNIRKDGKREKSLLPFYHNIKEANGDISKSVFFGFYNYFKEYIPAISENYEEERLFWLIRVRSNYSKLKSEGKEKYIKRK